jgi:hypothetical protein
MKQRIQTLSLLALVAAVAVGAARASTVVQRTLEPGQTIVFRPGALEVGSPVACAGRGKRVVARVPHRGRSLVSTSDWSGRSRTLRLTTRRNGAVVARCR